MSTFDASQLSHPLCSSTQQPASARARRHIRDILPVEIWLLVKNSYERRDLVAHASLYRVSAPITDALYGNAARRAAFWEEMCLKNGLGLLPDEEPDEVDWEKIVLECAEDARSCDHPECGERRLRENASQMKDGGMSVHTCWNNILSQDILMRSTIGDYPHKEHINKTSPLLTWVSFHEKTPGHRASPSWQTQTNEGPEDLAIDAHLWLPEDQNQTDFNTLRVQLLRKYDWNKHLIARRSFAVFPPVLGMSFWPQFLHGIEVSGKFGVTLDHWVRAVHAIIDDDAGTAATLEIVEYLHSTNQDAPLGTNPDVLDVVAFVRKCATVRGFLDMYRFEDIYIDSPGDPEFPYVICLFDLLPKDFASIF